MVMNKQPEGMISTKKESKECQVLNNSFELLADIAKNSQKKQDKSNKNADGLINNYIKD